MLKKSKWLAFVIFVGLVYFIQVKYREILRKKENTEENTQGKIDTFTQRVDDNENRDQKTTDASPSNLTYSQIHHFLLSTPQTVVRSNPPNFLTDVKNPCFAIGEHFVNIGNIDLSYALEKDYEIRCLPYVYIAGFAKCGTSDLHHNLMNHHLIFGFLKEDQLAEYENIRNSHMYEKYDILGRMELVENLTDMHLKESDFWDNYRCVKNFTLDRLSRRCTPELIIRSHIGTQALPDPIDGKRENLRDMVFLDSSPRLGEGHYSWNEEEIHWRSPEPFEFIPDRIHHASSNAKIIFMLRNPVARVFSDYRFIVPTQSAIEFHNKVTEAIEWWHNCTARYSIKVCAYGNAPMGLPIHNTRSCGSRGVKYKNYCSPYRQWGCANAIDRMRISMYHIYLQEWLRVFPRENILFIQLEDMYADKMGTIGKVLEFLGLPPLKKDAVKVILEKKATNKSKVNIEMMKETKTILEKFYKPFNEKLSKLLGQDMYLID